jgi:2-polyprenyl-6-methoxyphenol hydroxylase-like FAD-dependent oxidoreductase
VRLIRSQIAVAILAAAMTVSAAGCWLAALQLAPAALELLETAGVGAAKLAQSGDSPRLGMIELRRDPGGAPEYRDMGVDRSSGDFRWIPITDSTTDAQGWRPAVNFTNMDFQPRLAPAIPSRGDRYLAYAPRDPQTQAEKQGLRSFGDCFGEPVGTFRWNGRLFDYWLPDELPRVEEHI